MKITMRPLKSKATSSPRGFSMIELLITLGIGMILIAMAAPLVKTTINTYRLRGAGTEYANLLQQTRMRAVGNDRYYPIYASTSNGVVNGWAGMNAFADINLQGGATGTYAPSPALPNPQLGPDFAAVFDRSVLIRNRAAAPAVANLEAQYMPGVNAALVNINPNDLWSNVTVKVVTFGPRGLPCYLPAAPAAGNAGNCGYLFPNGTPVAFEIYLVNTQINSWESVTINPSGRIREWRYNAGNATWQPLN